MHKYWRTLCSTLLPTAYSPSQKLSGHSSSSSGQLLSNACSRSSPPPRQAGHERPLPEYLWQSEAPGAWYCPNPGLKGSGSTLWATWSCEGLQGPLALLYFWISFRNEVRGSPRPLIEGDTQSGFLVISIWKVSIPGLYITFIGHEQYPKLMKVLRVRFAIYLSYLLT